MDVSAAAIGALGEGRAHLGGRIGRKQLHVPFLLDPATQEVQVEVLVPQAFTDADDPPHRGVPVVDAVLLRILDQAQDEGRDAHDGVRLQPLDGVPLQFRDAVADADDAGAQLPDAQEVGQSRHEALVDGGHQLDDVPGLHAGAGEGFLLVEREAFQVLVRAAEGHGIPQGAGSRDVIYDLLLGAAQEIVVEQLQVLLFGEGNLHQVLQRPDLRDVDVIALEHPLIVLRMFGQVLQGLREAPLLIGLDGFGPFELNVCHSRSLLSNRGTRPANGPFPP